MLDDLDDATMAGADWLVPPLDPTENLGSPHGMAAISAWRVTGRNFSRALEAEAECGSAAAASGAAAAGPSMSTASLIALKISDTLRLPHPFRVPRQERTHNGGKKGVRPLASQPRSECECWLRGV